MLQIELKSNRLKVWKILHNKHNIDDVLKDLKTPDLNNEKNLMIRVEPFDEDIDLFFLNQITNLTGLDIGSNRYKLQHTDSILLHKNTLTYLRINVEGIESIIEDFTKLNTIITGSSLFSFSNFANTLEYLSIGGIDFDKIDFSVLKNLKILDVGGKCMNLEQSNIDSLKNLKGLSVSEIKQLTTLDFIKSFSNLEALHVSYLNNLRSLPDLSNLEKLSTVFIQYMSKLDDFSGLYHVNSLESLFIHCSKVGVEKMLPFTELPNLSKGGLVSSKYSDNVKLSKIFGHLGCFPNDYLID